ncbi:MAG: hypothetical protein GXP47_05035 [Acidobacteria bacterium]|nr:hypothetical protein [Acidobacteriota bacterium]
MQQRLARFVNRRQGVYGPLWQGRYRAKLVTDEKNFQQLVTYIHLNPVSAGMVEDPARYPWSGHREVLGRVKNPIVDVDEVLRLFGSTRKSARAAYTRRLKGAIEEEWIGEEPGRLPWWRRGRPPGGEDEDAGEAVRRKRAMAKGGRGERPSLSIEEYLERGVRVLGIELESLGSRLRSPEVVGAREMLAVVGSERWGFRVVDLAEAMGKSPHTISKAIGRATRRRRDDAEYRQLLVHLDEAIALARAGMAPDGSA